MLPVLAMGAAPEFRLERHALAGGAELITVFGQLTEGESSSSSDVPLLSVLRDTLGDSDPENDRLRYVWVLTSASPSLLQRVEASLPFFYWKPDFGKNADRTPDPVIDLSAASRGVWTTVAGALAQTLMLDSNGALIRSSTRSYRNNLADHRRLHLLEGLTVLSQLEDVPEVKTLLSDPELLEMQARLTLAGQSLGGLVNSSKLPEAYLKQRTKAEEMRGHNWELLRQRAEANGLYFEPLGLNGSSTHALLWVAKQDVGSERKFDGRFLGIADPFRDARLKNWSGYTERREVDAPNAREVDLIPLGLYSLEYPKVPLLLVDFRDTRAPKRREMVRHAATDTVSGVLGISRFGNWPYMAGSSIWNFVRTRHGDTTNRTARLKAYSQVRQLLALDHAIDPGLRNETQKRLEILGVNPLQDSVFDEAEMARRQYDALLRYADDPKGLAAKLKRDRQQELTAYDHGVAARAGFKLAHVATFGLYTHREASEIAIEERLDDQRKVARHLRFLETVAQGGPQTEVAFDLAEVKHALDDLATSRVPGKSAQVVERILRQTSDEETRALCQKALQSIEAGGQ
jgi:hypothetical protein